MANVVEIVISVDNAQGLSALNSTMTTLKQMGVEGDVAMRGVTGGSDAAAKGLDKVGESARGMGQHMTTSLDGVRLLSQEFGLRLPRALESMLSRMPLVTGAVNSLVGAFAGLAVVEVVARAGEAVYNLYEKYVSLDAVAEAYNKTVLEHRSEAWNDTKNIEMTTERLQLATEAAKQLNAESQKLGSYFSREAGSDRSAEDLIPFIGDAKQLVEHLTYPHQLAEAGVKNQEAADALYKRQQEQQHEMNRLRIEAAHAGDEDLGREQKITAELQKQNQLRSEDARYRSEQGFDVGAMFGMRAPRGPSATDSLQGQVDSQKAHAEEINLAREERNQRIQFENEATNAALTGIALLRAQEEQAIAAVLQKYRDGEISKETMRSERASLEQKYEAESLKAIREESEAAQKRADIERDASLTGLAKVQAEGQRKIDDVNLSQRNGKYLSGANADADRATAQAEQLRLMADSEKQYRVQEAEEDQRSQSDQLSGFAKVDAEVAASAQKRADAFEQMYGQMAHDSAQYIDAEKALENSEAIIAQSGDRQRAQLEEEIRQQTLQQTTEAAQAERRIHAGGIMGWVDDYHRGIAEVQAAEAASLAKISAEQSKTGVTGTAFDLYQQQKIAAEQKADAEIQQLNQQMAHQVAGVLQGAFDDPVHYIQNAMKKMMFNILADWLMQSKMFSGTFGRMLGGGAHPSSTGGSIASGVGAIGAATSGSVANGTIAQASVSPGYSGTAASSGGSVLGDASTLSQMGMSAASAMASGTSSSSSASDPWSDPTQMSSSDPASAAYHGPAASTAIGLGDVAMAGVGAYTGAKGMIGAFESGKASGILDGGMSGLAMGASIGALAGPAGALIGGAVGAAGGATAGLVGWATGEGGNLAAARYFKDSMRPQMEAAEVSYGQGSGDALSAISQIDSIASSGLGYMAQHFGASSANWARAAYIDKERKALEEQINSMAKGGKDYMSRSAAQFHTGGDISDFGGLDLGGGEGFIKALLGEKIANRSASAIHGSAIDAMNAGASPSDMAAHYLKTTSPAPSQASQAGGDTHHHWDVKAIDAASFGKMLRTGGGIEEIQRASNGYASRYAGDAAHG